MTYFMKPCPNKTQIKDKKEEAKNNKWRQYPPNHTT